MSEKLMQDFLRPFSPSEVGFIHTLAMEMETYGLAAGDVIALCADFMAELQVVNAPKPADQNLRPLTFPPCPECGHPCTINPVNVSKCTNVGGSWKTSRQCTNNACRFTELSEKTLAEWVA